jgi:hypothetical protein
VSDRVTLLNQLAINNGTLVRKELLPYGRRFIDDKDIQFASGGHRVYFAMRGVLGDPF